MRKYKSYVLVFDYEADPDLNHATVEADLYRFLDTRIKGTARKLGNCVLVGDQSDAFDIKMRFAEHIVDVSQQ